MLAYLAGKAVTFLQVLRIGGNTADWRNTTEFQLLNEERADLLKHVSQRTGLRYGPNQILTRGIDWIILRNILLRYASHASCTPQL